MAEPILASKPRNHAATRVLRNGGTDVTIQTALDAFTAAGGSLYLEGTFNLAAAIVPPDKPIKIFGSGKSTIINLGSNVIAMFTIGFDRPYTFKDFRGKGDGSAGQIMFDFGAAVVCNNVITIDGVDTEPAANFIEKIFRTNVASFPCFAITNCSFSVDDVAGTRFIDGPGRWQLASSVFTGSGAGAAGTGISGNPDLLAVGCAFSVSSDGYALGNSHFSACGFAILQPTGVITLSQPKNLFSACDFAPTASPTRAIDVLAAALDTVISGCTFVGTWGSERVRTASDNGTCTGNSGPFDVTEIGAANKNHYANNEGFTTSTIIGAFSKVDGAFLRTTDPAVGDDIDDGVLIGDKWINKTLKKTFINVDNAAGAAVWQQVIRIKTGTYTGDGTTSQGITGVGFSPTYLKIWRRDTVDNNTISIFETIPEIMDDNAAGGAAQHTATASTSHRFRTDRIISLDADGFTVDDAGSNGDPNASGVVYNYMAIG